jgi:hypothetical protein
VSKYAYDRHLLAMSNEKMSRSTIYMCITLTVVGGGVNVPSASTNRCAFTFSGASTPSIFEIVRFKEDTRREETSPTDIEVMT